MIVFKNINTTIQECCGTSQEVGRKVTEPLEVALFSLEGECCVVSGTGSWHVKTWQQSHLDFCACQVCAQY